MMGRLQIWPKDDAERIQRALSVQGAHLYVGHNGYVLAYSQGGRLHGYNAEPMKAACVAAGLPVIDCRTVSFEDVFALECRGPLTAVGRPPSPEPWGPLDYAPLATIAALYLQAGAEVLNSPIPVEEAAS